MAQCIWIDRLVTETDSMVLCEPLKQLEKQTVRVQIYIEVFLILHLDQFNTYGTD